MIKTKPETKAKPIVNPVFDEAMKFGIPLPCSKSTLSKAMQADKPKSVDFADDPIIAIYLQENTMSNTKVVEEKNDDSWKETPEGKEFLRKMKVIHINGIKTDNRVDNLAWRISKDQPWRKVEDNSIVEVVKIPRKQKGSSSSGSSGAGGASL